MRALSRSFPSKVIAALRLPWGEKLLAARACCWLFRLRAALGREPFPVVMKRVSRWASAAARRAGAGVDEPVHDPVQVCLWVERCARNLPGAYTCLPQALAGYLLCLRCGHRPVLRVGASRSPEAMEFRAHAWLELDGTVILGNLGDLDQYQVFENLQELVL